MQTQPNFTRREHASKLKDSSARRLPHRTLQGLFIRMMMPPLPGPGVGRYFCFRKITENQGIDGLILSGCRHIPRHRQVREERLNLGCAHVLGMPLLMKENEVPNPMDIGFLGPKGKVLESDHLPHLIQEFDLGIRDENGLLCHRCDTCDI